MNNEKDNIFENETVSPVTSQEDDESTVILNTDTSYEPQDSEPQETEALPEVEAEQVYDGETASQRRYTRPFEAEGADYSEFARQENQYGPYGNREYNPNYNTAYNAYSNPNFVQPSQPINNAEPEKPQKSNTGLKVFAGIISVVLVFALVFGGVIAWKYRNGLKAQNAQLTAPSTIAGAENAPTFSGEHVTPPLPEDALSTADIAAKVKPSIVGIVVYTNNSGASAGEGTGVIWEEDSTGTYTYIITCAHVISDPGIKVRVQTEKGILYDAEIVGLDERTDLGVVKIKASGLTKAEFGDSDALRVGDSVFAIGNPGGVEFFGSFTGGYVSAIDRPVDSEIGYTMKCIQHDAAINPGNSGGALVNVYGQVIGINSQKIAATDYEGMGFAIPMNSAREIIDQLTQYGYIPNRPKLGISYYPVSASTQYSIIALYQGLPAGTLIIDSIDEESALSGTEARRYDMIIAVNGQDLTTADVLLSLIENGEVGTKLTLTLCRVNNDYSVSTFDVEATLVEDKSGSKTEPSTEPDYVNPFENYNPYGY